MTGEETRVVGSSFESSSDAARSAFEQVPGDPDREGVATAEVARLWLTKGGFVGRVEFHAELAPRVMEAE